MSDLPKAHHEKIERHIADGETALDTRSFTEKQQSGEIIERTYLLTNHRFLMLRRVGKTGVTTIDSAFLDTLGGVKTKHTPPTEPNQMTIVTGVVALIAGFFSFGLLGGIDSGAMSTFTVIFGFIAAVVGVLLLIDAYNTEDGVVSIQLLTAEGEDALNITLPEDHLDFAASISKAATSTRS